MVEYTMHSHHSIKCVSVWKMQVIILMQCELQKKFYQSNVLSKLVQGLIACQVLGYYQLYKRSSFIYLFFVVGEAQLNKTPVCVPVCVNDRFVNIAVPQVCVCMHGLVFSPSVQLASDIPRSLNSLSEYMVGALRIPVPMGSSLKKSQWTTSSWPSRRFSNSYGMRT